VQWTQYHKINPSISQTRPFESAHKPKLYLEYVILIIKTWNLLTKIYTVIRTVLETAESFWKLVSKDRFPKLKDFALKWHSTFANTHICVWAYNFYYEASQIKNRNRMADETLDDCLRLANTSTSFDKGTIVSEKPRPQASHWLRFAIDCYCVVISIMHSLIITALVLNLMNLLF